MKKKYITFDTGFCNAIIVFPAVLYHRDMNVNGTILGAGFITLSKTGDTYRWHCYGDSVSLNVKSRAEDSEIANLMLSVEEN